MQRRQFMAVIAALGAITRRALGNAPQPKELDALQALAARRDHSLVSKILAAGDRLSMSHFTWAASRVGIKIPESLQPRRGVAGAALFCPLPAEYELSGDYVAVEIFKRCVAIFQAAGAELYLVSYTRNNQYKQRVIWNGHNGKSIHDQNSIDAYGQLGQVLRLEGIRDGAYDLASLQELEDNVKSSRLRRTGRFVRCSAQFSEQAPANSTNREIPQIGVAVLWTSREAGHRFFPTPFNKEHRVPVPTPQIRGDSPVYSLAFLAHKMRLDSPINPNCLLLQSSPQIWTVAEPLDHFKLIGLQQAEADYAVLLAYAKQRGCRVYCAEWYGRQYEMLSKIELEGTSYYIDLRHGGFSPHPDLLPPYAGWAQPLQMTPVEGMDDIYHHQVLILYCGLLPALDPAIEPMHAQPPPAVYSAIGRYLRNYRPHWLPYITADILG